MATCSDSLSLKCSVCLELYNDPRVLPCLHTYCLQCLEGLVSDDDTVTCPQCRAKHDVPQGLDVTIYPTDVLVLPELEIAKRESGQGEKRTCGLCTAGDVAVGYCNQCGEYLCDCCENIVHKKLKMYSSHEVISIDDDIPSLTGHIIKQKFYCHQHVEQKLEIYCTTCSRLTCPMCMLESTHKGHDYDFLKNVEGQLMEKIKLMTENIEKKESGFTNILAIINELETSVNQQRSEIEREINQLYDKYVTQLEENKRKLLSEVETIFTQNNKKIWAVKNELEMAMAHTVSCKRFSTNYLKQSNETGRQSFSLTNQLLERLTEVESLQYNLSYLQEVASCDVTLKPAEDKLVIGTLAVNNGSVHNGDVQVTSDKITIGQEAVLKCTINDSLCSLYNDWLCEYKLNDSLPVTCLMTNINDDGEFEVTFTPRDKGTYSFDITGNDIPLYQFTFNVDINSFIGCRVRRGPDWEYGDEDGGPENLGTIFGLSDDAEYDLVVDWDNNTIDEGYVYRFGYNNKYDLEVV